MTERELESREDRGRQGLGNGHGRPPREGAGAEQGGSIPGPAGGAWKRKRRGGRATEGSEARQKRLVWLVLGVVLPIGGGVFLWAAAGYFRCESDAFRRALAEHLSRESGMKVHVGPIEVQGLNLNAPNLSLSNGKGVLRYVEGRNLRATVAPESFFGGDWKVLELRIDQVDLHFASGDKEIESAAIVPVEGDGGKAGAIGFGLSADPGRWLMEGIQVRSLNLFWSEDDGMDSWVRGSRLTAANFSEDRKVRLSGGAAAAWGYSPAQVDFAELEIGRTEAQIVRARLREDSNESGGAGIVELSGSAGWVDEERVAMDIAIRDFNLEPILAEAWKRRLGGRISADLTLDGGLRAGGGGIASGAFSITGGWVKELPVLDALAEGSGESRYRHLRIGDDGFGGSVTLSRSGVTVDDLRVESGGIIKVAGSIGWHSGGDLAGELEVGIPAATLDRFRGGMPNFFGKAEDGFCKARLVVSGEVDAPREGLSEVLLAAAGSGNAPESPGGGLLPAGSKKEKTGPSPLNGDSEKVRIEKLFRALLE